MGYSINMKTSKSKFNIKKEYKEAALTALKKLGNGSTDKRAAGGSSKGERWFSWMNGVDPAQWDSLKEAMDDWRYPIKLDSDGNVVGINFNGGKLGDEEFMFETIAPFVEAGSALHMIGEDGDQWLWEFDGQKMSTKQGKVSFE